MSRKKTSQVESERFQTDVVNRAGPVACDVCQGDDPFLGIPLNCRVEDVLYFCILLKRARQPGQWSIAFGHLPTMGVIVDAVMVRAFGRGD